MIRELRSSNFREFFVALHGREPFPWQLRLAEQVCETGRMPQALDLPTGTGKTACIEIALFHLAYDLANRQTRLAPLRIVWVVDRRLIVDEAYERAARIAEQLGSAQSGILKNVGDALREIAGNDGPPLVVHRLRGGMPLEGDWARTPTQPTIISSTVDQVGSRLLFRGYGVSPRMRPIHAGLLGEDALIVLDEVHLAEPFRQTLLSIGDRKRVSHMPWQTVQLSATPRAHASTTKMASFHLTDEDWIDPVLESRLSRPKPATLHSLGRIPYASVKHAEQFADEALKHIAFDEVNGPKHILVVANRVALARRVYMAITSRLPECRRDRVTLLTGRNREVSKDRIRTEIIEHCKSNPNEESWSMPRSPLIVVATQCIEAGADLDFDVLITQIAPIDALRQRFGRLNRMGRPIEPLAAIIAVDSEVSASAKPDAVYGSALRETWRWLQTKAASGTGLDFAASALSVSAEECEMLSGAALNAPVLMPQHIDALSRTNPEPNWSPDPSLYLHGAQPALAEINIVWRADLPRTRELINAVLALVPPRMGEAVTVPISAVRKWMRGDGDDGGFGDMEVGAQTDESPHIGRTERRAWRWRGLDEGVEKIEPDRLRPGDTIVVNAAEGGCDRFGWDPDHSQTVEDVADVAAIGYSRHTFAVRLHPGLLEPWSPVAAAIDEARDAPTAAVALIDHLLSEDSDIVLPENLRRSLTALRAHAKRKELYFAYSPDGEERGADGAILFAKGGLTDAGGEAAYESATESDEIAAQGFRSGAQSLESHSMDVRMLAQRFTDLLNLPAPLANDVALAAFLHDLGKADSRFQRYLTGDPWSIRETAIAKSGMRRSRAEDRRARAASGLPENWRHEALSVRIACVHPDFATAHDPELVLWLIGTHHGFGRPAFPHAEPRDDEPASYFGFVPYPTPQQPLRIEPFPGPQRIDFALPVMTENGPSIVDWQTMFQRLQQRYGTWGLAWLETIVRLADHRASEAQIPKITGVSA